MVRVSIVVVTHQSAEFIGACLGSIAQIPDSEVVVIDNASSDSTSVRVSERGIHLIANHENRGFAAAVNQGVRATSAPLILLLNPDASIENSIEPLLRCFNDEKVGGAGGLLVGEDGLPQTGFMARNLPTAATLIFEALGINHFFPGNRINWHYRCLGNDPMAAARVDQPAGAFFAFRRSAWEKLGGFDERFRPVWFEDVDFCARLLSAGYSVLYEPEARAGHHGGHSVGRIPGAIREKYWYGSLLEYAAKHFHPTGFVAVCLSVIAGSAARGIAAFPRDGLRGFVVYGSVVRLSFARLLGMPIRRIGQHG